MPVDNRGGDVRGEIGEPKKLAEVGSVQLLPPRQIAELTAVMLEQQVVETVGADDQPDQCAVGFRGRREWISVINHHPDFLAGAAQMYRMGERQSWLVIEPIQVGCGEAIIQQ